MNNKSISIGGIFLSIIIISFVVYMCVTFKPIERSVNNYYQVYLGGDKIGMIESDTELYNLIDSEQKDIKEKYHVDNVYSPSGLEVHSVSTYKNNCMTAKEVYEEIKDIDPFTIEGYEINIKYKNGSKKTLYILNKEDLDLAIRNTVLTFVDEEQYDDYLNGTQKEIIDEGKEITKIYFDDEITIRKTYISTEEEIIDDIDKLSQYFLFGKTDLNETYIVKENDTIEKIAEKNKLGVQDLLIANPDIPGENALLAIGQEVNVAGINPLSSIVVESFDTEYQVIKYETKAVFDKTLDADQSYVKQQGSNGLVKATFASKEMNGSIITSALVSQDVITQAVDKIIVYGAKNVVYYGNTTYWAWPTDKPFKIASYFGWRIHPIRKERHIHSGVDIISTPTNNIYAVQDGTVISAMASGYNAGAGKNIKIRHENGYVSQYMHLSSIRVKVGDKVDKGQIIGIMGCTGSCTGTHLHYTIYKDGSLMDPLKLYK